MKKSLAGFVSAVAVAIALVMFAPSRASALSPTVIF